MEYRILNLGKMKIIATVFVASQFLILNSMFLAPQALAQETEASSSVRDKVRQTIENLTKKPRAIIGNLDNISDSTLQIKNLQNKTSLVATNDKTVYFKYSGGKKSEIKFEDLAIGNFTIALGYRNSNDTLDTSRVLVFDKAPFIDKKVVLVEIDTITKNSFTASTKNGENWTVDATKAQVTYRNDRNLVESDSVSNLNEGDLVIVIGMVSEKKSGTIIANRIHIIKGPVSKVSKSTPKPKPTPSMSPKPSASPKASIKPTP